MEKFLKFEKEVLFRIPLLTAKIVNCLLFCADMLNIVNIILWDFTVIFKLKTIFDTERKYPCYENDPAGR